jgi:hypothetical protein
MSDLLHLKLDSPDPAHVAAFLFIIQSIANPQFLIPIEDLYECVVYYEGDVRKTLSILQYFVSSNIPYSLESRFIPLRFFFFFLNGLNFSQFEFVSKLFRNQMEDKCDQAIISNLNHILKSTILSDEKEVVRSYISEEFSKKEQEVFMNCEGDSHIQKHVLENHANILDMQSKLIHLECNNSFDCDYDLTYQRSQEILQYTEAYCYNRI